MSWTTDAGLGLLLGGLLAVGPLAAQTEPAAIVVTAAETVGTTGDADGPAIWVSPADPARSLILGTDKAAGLYIYRLDGAVRRFLPDGRLNNVDLRPFTPGGQEVALAGASRRDNDTLSSTGSRRGPHAGLLHGRGGVRRSGRPPCRPVATRGDPAGRRGRGRRLWLRHGPVPGATETDGLDVTAQALPGFPAGLLVMMDDQNAGFTTTFKLIGWEAIGAALAASLDPE